MFFGYNLVNTSKLSNRMFAKTEVGNSPQCFHLSGSLPQSV